MGYYINPKTSTKEAWLKANGRRLSEAEVDQFDYSSLELPVCLVDNGMFTAAGIAYSPEERAAFRREDGRPKLWYAVSKDKLREWYKES